MATNDDRSWIAKALASGLLKWVGLQLATLGAPIALALGTLLIGWLQNGPWMWSITAAALAFGGSAAGVHHTLDIISRYRVAGKVVFAGPRVAIDMKTGQVALGINVLSTAEVPVEFEVKSIRTNLGTSYAANKPYGLAVFEMPPRGQGWFVDHAIPATNDPSDPAVASGSVIATVAYGRPGARKHELAIRCGVHLKRGDAGAIEAASWELIA
jgi:hypothetical protein